MLFAPTSVDAAIGTLMRGDGVAPALSDRPQADAEEVMLEHARLDKASFFAALREATGEDLSTSMFSRLIYRKYAGEADVDHDEKAGVTLRKFQLALGHAEVLGQAFDTTTKETGAKEVVSDTFVSLLKNMFALMAKAKHIPPTFGSTVMEYMGHMSDSGRMQDVFDRWDTDGSGAMDKGESMVLGMAVLFMAEAFIVIGRGENLNKENYGQALGMLGFADVAKSWQGLFANSMYSLLDSSGDGQIQLPEFWTGVSRLLRPIAWEKALTTIPGYPGWHKQPKEEIGRLVSSLQTGDIVLVQYQDPMSRFVQFSTNSPWNHIAVVVRHAARPGIPNLNTEELLVQFPQRRKTHVSCSPGYCRCFDQSWQTRFSQSKIEGSGISLLESTAEGIHVYDFAHRMFESRWAKENITFAAVRRLSDNSDGKVSENRDSYSVVERFVSMMRGHLFTTGNEDLRGALERNATGSGLDTSSAFCSQVVVAFYKHMGWMDENSSTLYMPCDFDQTDAPTFPAWARPVEVKGQFGPVEIITSK